jgi:hypothetical protein
MLLCSQRQVVAGLTCNGDSTWKDRVLVLAMAAALYDEEPPFGGKMLDHFLS